jgi:hypothetical protein
MAFCQTLRVYGQGEWRLKLGLPYVNNFVLHPEDEALKTRTGWAGLEAGVEYQYSGRGFLALEASLNGAAEGLGMLDHEGEFDTYVTRSLGLSNNSVAGRFSFGYGIGLAANTWAHTRDLIPDTVPPHRPLVERTSLDLGLLLNTYYRIGRAFHIGLIYRPCFFKFRSEEPWGYEHVLSLDIMWRIRLGPKPRIQ